MNTGRANRTWILAALVTLFLVQAAPAEVALFGETSTLWFQCDKDGSRHPNSAQILQTVSGNYGDLDRFRLSFEYERALDLLDDESALARQRKAAKAKVQVTIRLLRDGSWTNVGKLKGNVQLHGDAATAHQDKVFRIALEPGDVLQWRFNLKKFSSMADGEAFVVRAALFAEEDDDQPAPSGQWSAQAGFGTFSFNVNPAFTRVTRITYMFSSFRCGGRTVSGGVSISSSSGWAITNNQFTITNDLDPSSATQNMTIEGTFNTARTEASGTWTADWYGDRCTGTWSGSPD